MLYELKHYRSSIVLWKLKLRKIMDLNYQMRIYMRKKGEEVIQLTLYEADNSYRVSSRSVIYYHNSNSINIAIAIL